MNEPPSDRELEALKLLWERGEATVREIFEALNRKGNNLAYTTVLSLMQVMEQKALVDHRPAGKAYVYSPKSNATTPVANSQRDFSTRSSTECWTSTWCTPWNHDKSQRERLSSSKRC